MIPDPKDDLRLLSSLPPPPPSGEDKTSEKPTKPVVPSNDEAPLFVGVSSRRKKDGVR